MTGIVGWGVVLITIAWQVNWWSVATRRYLRFQKPFGFAGPLLAVSVLSAIVAVVTLMGLASDTAKHLPNFEMW
ncbi:MAG: hypothetical protein Phyf2KO_15220 [Phycisphaerales bacterium]